MPAISTTRRSCISPQRPRTVGVRKRAHQVGGLGPQLGLAAADRLEQRRDLGAGFDAVLLHLAQLLVDLLQHVTDRRDQLVERLVLAGDLGGGVLLEPRQALVRQLQELLVARLQRRPGHAPGSCLAAAAGPVRARAICCGMICCWWFELGAGAGQRLPQRRALGPRLLEVLARPHELVLHFAEPPRGLVEERLRGAHGGLVGGDRLGQLAAELAARQHPGGQRARGESGEKRQQNDSIHRAQTVCRRAWTRQLRQNRVDRRSVTAPTERGSARFEVWRRTITRL